MILLFFNKTILRGHEIPTFRKSDLELVCHRIHPAQVFSLTLSDDTDIYLVNRKLSFISL
jgi:hypothetical protein